MPHIARTLAVIALAFATFASHAQAPMPQPQTHGSVTYLSGGAGDEEVQYIKASMKDYALALSFSRAGGEYVASVAVTVKDGKGTTVFEAPSVGPFLLLKLPSGKYSVIANYQSQSKVRPVSVVHSASSVTAIQFN